MDSIIRYSVNIAMESMLILVVAIILVTLFWQKRLFVTTIPLIFLSCFIISMIVTQIVTWTFLILGIPAKYGEGPMQVVYILDYISSYGVTAAFYYYVEALAKEQYKRIGVAFKTQKYIKEIIIAWGAVSTVLYVIALFVPAIYHLENGIAVYSIPAFIVMHIMSMFACICALIFMFRHRKVIGRHEVALTFIFGILIIVFFVADELYEVCIGHVMTALFVFMLYVRIDLHKGLLLERQEKEITEWKTQIMLSQMQPHFLYNVLTTISGLCEMQNATEARDVVNKFADYFRTNIESLGKEKKISFEKELEHIKTYLWLEKVRFEDSLNVCYEIGTTDFDVPSLSIQPIVENAVKHGILPKDDGGTVTIRTYETSLDYVIVIEDDGVGFDVNEKQNDSRTHVGIENVSKRLEIICNGSCEIKSDIGRGTIVTIHIPKGETI